jgi:hypothetical protein
MVEQALESEITIRRKMSVTGNKVTTIPIDVIDAWGGKIPKNVIFTVFRQDGKVKITIEPAPDNSNS